MERRYQAKQQNDVETFNNYKGLKYFLDLS